MKIDIIFLVIYTGNYKNEFACAQDSSFAWGDLEKLPRFYKIKTNMEEGSIDNIVLNKKVNDEALTDAEKYIINNIGEINLTEERFCDLLIDK